MTAITPQIFKFNTFLFGIDDKRNENRKPKKRSSRT